MTEKVSLPPKVRTAIARGAQSARTIAERRRHRPLDYMRWLRNQRAFLAEPSRRKMIRQGNQWGGKTTVSLAEVHYRCIGRHPFLQVKPPPIDAWIICASWPQSIAIQKKFWDLVGGTGELVEGVAFNAKTGFGTTNPTVQYKNGSVVRFKTTKQDAIDLASDTIDVALFDEPPSSQRVYSEIQKRVMRRQGVVLVSMTPINAPIDWIREMVEKGKIRDHHARLEPAELIPVGYRTPLRLPDGTPMDAAWIEQVRAETPPHEVPVVLDGEWEVRVVDRLFSAFRDGEGGHVTSSLPKGDVYLSLGNDHGDGTNFSQVAVLVAVVLDHTSRWPRVWVLDEWVSGATTTPDMDARAVIQMLQRSRLRWSDLDHAYGDRKHGGSRLQLGKKSNKQLMQQLSGELGVGYEDLRPRIRTVKRGEGQLQGSVSQGVRFLHTAMVRPGHFHIHRRCKRLIESINRWDYRDTEWKHAIDALRYALHPWIFPRPTRTGVAAITQRR